MTINFLRQSMAQAFSENTRTYSFLTGMAQSAPETHVFDTQSVVVDIVRGNERIAVDVVRGTGGRSSSQRKFSTKEYEPPVYDENAPMTPNELLNRQAGKNPFVDDEAAIGVSRTVMAEMIRLRNMIIRSIEKQASDALFTGTIPLVNGDTVDYKQKATHQITVSTAWSTVTADVIGDIEGAINVNRVDGKVESDVLVMGTTALKNFLASDQMQAAANFRRIDALLISNPQWITSGGVLHGEVTIGSHRLQLWSFPQNYEVPLGFSLPNEGQSVPYVPVDAVLVTSSTARFDLYFAGLPILVPTAGTALESLIDSVPQFVPMEFQEYANVDTKRSSIQVGVRSAPLWVPTQIDGFSVLDTTP